MPVPSATRNAKLERLIAEIRRAHFARKSERIEDDQPALALEELETAIAKDEVKNVDPDLKIERARKPHTQSGAAAPRVACCGGILHEIGEDTLRRPTRSPPRSG